MQWTEGCLPRGYLPKGDLPRGHLPGHLPGDVYLGTQRQTNHPTPAQMTIEAGDTHPTGMHSWLQLLSSHLSEFPGIANEFNESGYSLFLKMGCQQIY